MKSNGFSGYFMALTAIFFWSFNIIIASYFATSLTPFEIGFGRWFVASLILVPLAWKGMKTNFKQLLNLWPLVLSLAVTGIVLDNTLIYYAGRTASAVDMGLLDVTGPIFLVILSRIFLKTPISNRQIMGLIIAVFGVLVIIMQGDLTQITKFNFVSGDFWMLFNTFCFAVYSLLQAKRPQNISQSTMLGATAITGTVIMLPILLFSVPAVSLLHLTPIDYGVFIYLGIFNSVISYLCWNSALARIGNIKTSIIYYLLPLFSSIEAYLILHEQLYWSQLVGGVLVIAGIAMTTLVQKDKNISASQTAH